MRGSLILFISIGQCISHWSAEASVSYYRKSSDCSFDLKKDIPKTSEPLILKGSKGYYKLLVPEVDGKTAVIRLRQKESVTLACSGKNNVITATKTAQAEAKCKQGTMFTLKQRDHHFKELRCSKISAAEIKKTNKKCAGGKGNIVDIGFETHGWQRLISICHSTHESSTYYSTHTIFKSIGGKAVRHKGRPPFAVGNNWLYRNIDIDKVYKIKNQKAIFRQILGKVSNSYVSGKKSKFISRGHLSPDADFLLPSWQLSTYFYINVAPQWQSINNGNWRQLETMAKTIATKLGADLEVVTGVYGVSKMIDDKGKQREVYLAKFGKHDDGDFPYMPLSKSAFNLENTVGSRDLSQDLAKNQSDFSDELRRHGGKLAVPEYFWKVLRNTKDDACIAFVSTNNPYLKKAPHPFCEDVCSKYNWPKLQDNLFKGFIFCCEYAKLRRVVNYAPSLKCKKVLKFVK